MDLTAVLVPAIIVSLVSFAPKLAPPVAAIAPLYESDTYICHI